MWTWWIACRGPEPRSDGPPPVDHTAAPAATHTGDPPPSPPATAHTAAPTPDWSLGGPHAVTESSDRWNPAGGRCEVPRTTFVPDTPVTDAWVVLAHGFSRTQGAVADLAHHLASWGVPVVTTTSCHATPLDNDPAQDATDLRELADRVGAGPRLYVGHSAGGLRAVLAAAGDPAAVGVLGLDLVDAFHLAEDAAPSVSAPMDGLAGEPYACNSNGNGDAVFAAAPAALLLHVVDADHCDFEWPTDLGCTAFCAQPGDRAPADVQDVIHGMATAWVLWRAGAEPAGEAYWLPGGAVHDALIAGGALR